MMTLSRKTNMNHSDIPSAIISIAPPIGVSVLVIFGYPIYQWVLVATLIYTLIQIYILIRDKIWNRVDKHNLEVLHKDDDRHHPPVFVEDLPEIPDVPKEEQ
jgi:hypothetical protein